MKTLDAGGKSTKTDSAKEVEMNMNSGEILVTGGNGFLGRNICRELKDKGYRVSAPSHQDFDLLIMRHCMELVRGKDIVIHAAAHVGGIGYNQLHPGEMFYDNALMSLNIMEAARQNGVKKFVAIGTICSYPRDTPVPFREKDLWSGYPEPTNAPYGLAKKMLLVQAQAYRAQYKFNAIYLLPVNLYGPGDDFDPHSSHVIPALIRKCVEAKRNQVDEIEVWGDGRATREFLYVQDCAEAIVLATEKYECSEPVNIGAGFEISISDLVDLIVRLTGYEGKVTWNTHKPDGQMRRMLDISRAAEQFGFEAHTDFETGLERTIAYYQDIRVPAGVSHEEQSLPQTV